MKTCSHLRIDKRWQSRLSRVMQAVLVDLIFIGLDRGNSGIVVNALVSLGVTHLPAILERDYRTPMDARLILQISSMAFLHTLGVVDSPGLETSFYAGVWWWDHLTHVLSLSVITAAGYVTTRAVDEHMTGIYLPPRSMFVLILLFVLALDVFWEAIGFTISGTASLAGTTPVLTQRGLGNTPSDLVSDTADGVIVAVWGTAHLSDVIGVLQRRFETVLR